MDTPAFVADAARYARDDLPPGRAQRDRAAMVSLGFWQNFGADRPLEHQRAILRRAFDLGITHFDLANNYGPPYGAAERTPAGCSREDSRRTATS